MKRVPFVAAMALIVAMVAAPAVSAPPPKPTTTTSAPTTTTAPPPAQQVLGANGHQATVFQEVAAGERLFLVVTCSANERATGLGFTLNPNPNVIVEKMEYRWPAIHGDSGGQFIFNNKGTVPETAFASAMCYPVLEDQR